MSYLEGYVYGIECSIIGAIKIGHASHPRSRLKQLQAANPSMLDLKYVFEGDARREHALHARFADHRIHGEWFSPTKELIQMLEACEKEYPVSADSTGCVKGTVISGEFPGLTILPQLNGVVVPEVPEVLK